MKELTRTFVVADFESWHPGMAVCHVCPSRLRSCPPAVIAYTWDVLSSCYPFLLFYHLCPTYYSEHTSCACSDPWLIVGTRLPAKIQNFRRVFCPGCLNALFCVVYHCVLSLSLYWIDGWLLWGWLLLPCCIFSHLLVSQSALEPFMIFLPALYVLTRIALAFII